MFGSSGSSRKEFGERGMLVQPAGNLLGKSLEHIGVRAMLKPVGGAMGTARGDLRSLEPVKLRRNKPTTHRPAMVQAQPTVALFAMVIHERGCTLQCIPAHCTRADMQLLSW